MTRQEAELYTAVVVTRLFGERARVAYISDVGLSFVVVLDGCLTPRALRELELELFEHLPVYLTMRALALPRPTEEELAAVDSAHRLGGVEAVEVFLDRALRSAHPASRPSRR